MININLSQGLCFTRSAKRKQRKHLICNSGHCPKGSCNIFKVIQSILLFITPPPAWKVLYQNVDLHHCNQTNNFPHEKVACRPRTPPLLLDASYDLENVEPPLKTWTVTDFWHYFMDSARCFCNLIKPLSGRTHKIKKAI